MDQPPETPRHEHADKPEAPAALTPDAGAQAPLPEDVAKAAEAANEAIARAPEQSPTPPAPTTTSAPAPTNAPAPDAAAELSPSLDAEIDAAMAKLDAEDGLKPVAKQSPDAPAPRKAIRGPRVVEAGREHRKGIVVSVGPSDLFIEFGPKELGITAKSQWPEEEQPKVGDELEVIVDRFEPNDSVYICSRPGAVVKAEWEMMHPGQVIEAVVTGSNKGGLEMEVGGHRAFLPASHIALERVEDLKSFVGQKLACEITQLDRRGRGNIVLSRRALLKQERKEAAGKLKDTLKEGDVVEGTVRKIMDFGAFVDIGGVDGLVHISDLSYDRVGFGAAGVEKHVKEGETVKVKVLKVDWDKDRISLGIKQTQADPFTEATGALEEGAIVSGTVTRLADFGAFVELQPGVEGLVHISEIAWKRINSPASALKEGEVVQVKVLKLDPASRKISLSIKQTTEDPLEAEAKKSREKDSAALRRLRAKFGKQEFKGGLG